MSTAENGLQRAGTPGGDVGFGADLIIMDDLMKADAVHSVTERENTKRFCDGTLISRLNDPEKGRIVLIQQRMHEDERVVYIREKDSDTHLNLPAIGDGELHTRCRGALLFPERFSEALLERIRRVQGNFIFSALYLQNPTPLESHRIR